MPLGNLVGVIAESSSSRVNDTAPASAALALWVIKMRPAEVAIHMVPASAVVRAMAEMVPPWRVAPYDGPVGSALGGHLYYNFSDDSYLERCVQGIKGRIESV